MLTPVKTQTISPKRYLDLIKSSSKAHNIDRVRFIPPQLGKGGYGKVEVTYRVPVLVEC